MPKKLQQQWTSILTEDSGLAYIPLESYVEVIIGINLLIIIAWATAL